jgi:hypothetical protein
VPVLPIFLSVVIAAWNSVEQVQLSVTVTSVGSALSALVSSCELIVVAT